MPAGGVGEYGTGQTDEVMVNKSCRALHEALGIAPNYGAERRLPFYEEATELVDVGPNLVGRMQRLTPEAARSWGRIVEAAAGESVRLLIVSGFRSYDYQAELIRNKLTAGQPLADILKVSAAPGYSQHHTGRAVDIASPGSRPLTEEFEQSEAYAWLQGNAKKFGFSMTYPRDNRYGFIFEPWHWSL